MLWRTKTNSIAPSCLDPSGERRAKRRLIHTQAMVIKNSEAIMARVNSRSSSPGTSNDAKISVIGYLCAHFPDAVYVRCARW
jgi:hypothetical protein